MRDEVQGYGKLHSNDIKKLVNSLTKTIHIPFYRA
uniref:Uncharacterized protein n=1 Tax=Arundo donax TaxID=35708 RepID=A0A0A8YVJ2_ARUDO